jgi:hypothetical protein
MNKIVWENLSNTEIRIKENQIQEKSNSLAILEE